MDKDDLKIIVIGIVISLIIVGLIMLLGALFGRYDCMDPTLRPDICK